MVAESTRDAFTKRVLGEKHFNGVMYENPRGPRLPLSPSADAHVPNLAVSVSMAIRPKNLHQLFYNRFVNLKMQNLTLRNTFRVAQIMSQLVITVRLP